MKILTYAILLPALVASAWAQTEYQAKAALSPKDGRTFLGHIIQSTDKKIRFKRSPDAAKFEDAEIESFKVIFPLRPDKYVQGIDLYEAGDYTAARALFAEYKEKSSAVATIAGNYHTLCAFQEMECFRMEGDYKALATALQSFKQKPLKSPDDLRQLNLYVMWDAVASKDWERLLTVTENWIKKELPSYQQVQVSYCRGLALDKLNRAKEALPHYALAITADAGASQPIAANAAYNILQIYAADPVILEAIPIWGTADENKNSFAHIRLKQAISLAKIYKKNLGGKKALTGEAAKFAELKIKAAPPEATPAK